MELRKIKVTLITNTTKEEYNLLGKYDLSKNIITYNENKQLQTRVILDLNSRSLSRDNKDLKVDLLFDENGETSNELFIKELNKYLTVKIKTESYNLTENSIEIVYIILDSNDKITYKIEF